MKISEIHITSNETCNFYSITKTTLGNWVAKGFPRTKRNQYPLKDGFDWWRKNVIGEDAGDLQNEKLKFQRARTRLEELKAAEQEGRLIDRDTPLTWLIGLGTAAKIAFWSLPRRLSEILAPISDPKEVERIMRDEIRKIISRLRDAGRKGGSYGGGCF